MAVTEPFSLDPVVQFLQEAAIEASSDAELAAEMDACMSTHEASFLSGQSISPVCSNHELDGSCNHDEAPASPARIGSNAQGAPPADQRERVRKRNREAQARRRHRLKVEQQALEMATQTLTSEIMRQRSIASELRSRKASLLARCRSAEAAAKAHRIADPVLPTAQSLQAYVIAPRTAAPSLFAPSSTEQRPLATFHAHAPLSMPLLATHARRRRTAEKPSSPTPHADPHPYGAHAPNSLDELTEDPGNVGWLLRDHQSTVAMQHGTSSSNVCWFVQMPQEVLPGLPLSCSSHLASQQCAASIMLHFLLTHAEGALLTAERKHLLASRVPDDVCSGSCGTRGAACGVRAHGDEVSTGNTRPSQWSQRAVEGLGGVYASPPVPVSRHAEVEGWKREYAVSCGVNLEVPLAAVVPFMARRLFMSYRGTIPEEVWRAVAHDFVALVSRMLGNVSTGGVQSEDMSKAAAGDGCGGAQTPQAVLEEEQMQATLGSVTQVAQLLVETVAGALKEGAEGPWPHTKCSHSQLLRVNTLRGQAVSFGWAFTMLVVFADAPKRARSLSVSLAYPHGYTASQVEGAMVEILIRMRMTRQQKHELAKVWAMWVHGSAKLQSERAAATRPLLSSLLDPSDIPRAWLERLSQPRTSSYLHAGDAPQLTRTDLPFQGNASSGAGTASARAVGDSFGGAGAQHSNPAVGGSPESSLGWATKVLGGNVCATLTAQKAVHHLKETIKHETELYIFVKALYLLPCCCWTAEQHLVACAEQLRNGALVGDYLHLVFLAAQEHRLERVFEESGVHWGKRLL